MRYMSVCCQDIYIYIYIYIYILATDRHISHEICISPYEIISKNVEPMFMYVCGSVDHRPMTNQLNVGSIWLTFG